MSEAEQEYAGVLTVEDGMLQFPEKYARAHQFVCRQRAVTQDFRSGSGIRETGWREDFDGVQNPHLSEDEVTLKVYGEPEELYRVDVDGVNDE